MALSGGWFALCVAVLGAHGAHTKQNLDVISKEAPSLADPTQPALDLVGRVFGAKAMSHFELVLLNSSASEFPHTLISAQNPRVVTHRATLVTLQ